MENSHKITKRSREHDNIEGLLMNGETDNRSIREQPAEDRVTPGQDIPPQITHRQAYSPTQL